MQFVRKGICREGLLDYWDLAKAKAKQVNARLQADLTQRKKNLTQSKAGSRMQFVREGIRQEKLLDYWDVAKAKAKQVNARLQADLTQRKKIIKGSKAAYKTMYSYS